MHFLPAWAFGGVKTFTRSSFINLMDPRKQSILDTLPFISLDWDLGWITRLVIFFQHFSLRFRQIDETA